MRGVLVAIGVAVVLAGALYGYERTRRSPLRFTYLTGPLEEAKYAELAAKPGWARTSLQVEPGVSLNGLVRKPQQSDAPWLLYYSGNDENMLARGQNVLTGIAHGDDFGLAVFAYRGFSSSGGTPEVAAIAADATAILDHVAGLPGVDRGRLHVVGFSIGGYFAVRAVAAASEANRRVASLSLLASVNDIVMLRRSPLIKFALGDELSTQPFLSSVPAPVLVLQGGADETLAGTGQSRDIAKTLGQKASYREFEGVAHEPLLEHPPALQAVHDFVLKR